MSDYITPVMMVDPNGTIAIELIFGIKIAIIAIAVILIYAVLSYMTQSDSIANSNGLADGLQDLYEDLKEETAKLIGILESLTIKNLSSLGQKDWHHIVAQTDIRAYFSRLILHRAGINVQDNLNLAHVNRPMHWVMHTNAYYASVTVILLTGYGINRKEGVIDALTMIKTVIEGVSSSIG